MSHPKQESQKEAFERTARELGVELEEDKLKEALRRMKQPPPDPDEKPKSDDG